MQRAWCRFGAPGSRPDPIDSGDPDGPSPLRVKNLVRGHEKVPTSGQLKGPLVATKSTHWWPGEVPTPH